MRKSLVVFGAAALALSVMAAGPRPKMKLRVSTHSGPLPLELKLTGAFTGVAPQDITGCLVTVESNYTSPAGITETTKKELPCVDGQVEAGSPVATSFKKEMTLKDPGVYSYRMVLVDKAGQRMASTSQEVKVYRSSHEMGVTVGLGAGRTNN